MNEAVFITKNMSTVAFKTTLECDDLLFNDILSYLNFWLYSHMTSESSVYLEIGYFYVPKLLICFA